MPRKNYIEAAIELSSELKSRAKRHTGCGPGLSSSDINKAIQWFLPEGLKNCKSPSPCSRHDCPSRCQYDYWLDHGRITKNLMERVAIKTGGNIELYGITGLLHDLDYLKHPHDRGSYVGKHPIPLVKYLMNRNANPYMCLAILEHAPHLKLNQSSALSFSLTGCEELATLISFNNQSKYLSLSPFAKELMKNISVSKFVDANIDGIPRVFVSPERSINLPLEAATKL